MENLRFDYPVRTAFYFAAFVLVYEIGVYLANDMIMPGMIDVIRTFQAPDSLISTSLTAFILGGGSLQLFLGPISDRYGRYKVMICGVLFFLLTNIVICMAPNMTAFIITRFFQGMGLCFISVIAYPSLHELFVEMQAIRVISVMNNITITAPLAGPLLGVFIINATSWRMVFIVNAVMAAVALIGLIIYMPETVGIKQKDGTQISYTALKFEIIKNNYKTLLRDKRFMMGSIALGFASVPIISWIGVSPLILMKSAHLSIFEYGLWQLPVFVCAIFGNLLMRKLTYKIILPRLAWIGSIIILIGLTLGVISTLVTKNYLCVVLGISIYAFGLSFLTGPLNRLTLFCSSIPKGTVSALMSTIMMLTTALGNQVAGWIYLTMNNLYFTLYCFACGIIFWLAFSLMRKFPSNT